MIFNSISSLVRRKTFNLIDLTYLPFKINKTYSHINQPNQYYFSTQQDKTINSQPQSQQQQQQQTSTKKHRKIQIKQSSQNHKNKQKMYMKTLIQLFKDYRQSLQDEQFSFSSFAAFCKLFASNYKKSNHGEYNRSKEQIQRLLIKFKECQVKKFTLVQFTNVLDFIRIISNLETVSFILIDETKLKLFNLLDPVLENISTLTLSQICLLYSKLNPLHYQKIFSISSVLHDKLAQRFDENKGLDVSLMQIFVLIKSMSKKQFLSFPDKKILQMALIDLKFRDKIDNSMILQLSMAFKDINIKANISNYSIYAISYRIFNKAIKMVKRGLRAQQIQKILSSKNSLQQKHQQIIKELYQYLLLKLKQNHNTYHSKSNLKLFHMSIKQLSKHHNFKPQDKSIVVQCILKLFQQYQTSAQMLTYLEIQLLQIIRTNFFSKDMHMLDGLMRSQGFKVKWSFIYQYSYHGVLFPVQLLVKKLEEIEYYNMKIDSKFIKRVVSLSKQRKQVPSSGSPVIQTEFNKWLQVIKNYEWNMQSLQTLVKLSYAQDNKLIQQFHNQFSKYYLPRLSPTKDDITHQKTTRKGQKSPLFIFWQYLLLFYNFQSHTSFTLIQSIPTYAIYTHCSKIKSSKNKEITSKIMVLTTINSMLENKQISVKDKQITLIFHLLTVYIDDIGVHNQGVLDQFFMVVRLLIRQYQKIRSNVIPYFNHLIVKVLNTHDKSIRNSLYYRHFLTQLLNSPTILTTDNAHQYFKTSILRQALATNLLLETHLSQLQYNYFSKDNETQLLKSLTNQHKFQQFTPFNLTCYLKADKDQESLKRDYNIICQIVEKSSLKQLYEYLIHYSWQRREVNDRILVKICKEFISKLIVSNDDDVVAVVMNIGEKLSKIDKKVHVSLIKTIIGQLVKDLAFFCLPNHLYMLKIIQEYNIIDNEQDDKDIISTYRHSLWRYVRGNKNNGYLSLDIMLQLAKIEDMFTLEDYQFVQCFAINRPLAYLKAILLSHHEEQIIKDKVNFIASLFTKTTEKSIYTLYFENKYRKILSMDRNKVIYLNKANTLALELFKMIQTTTLRLKIQQQQGQFLYRIGQRIVIFFTDNKNKNELNFILRFLKLNRQSSIEIVIGSVNLGKKEAISLLHTINQKLKVEQKIQEQQIKKIEQFIELK